LPQLAAIRLREILLPLKSPFRISSGTVTDRRILLLELEDVEGVSGWSECVAAEKPNYSPETVDTCWFTITRWFAPAMIGRPFQEPSQVHGMLEGVARGHPMAKAAVEMGTWELTARLRKKPLARLLGGTRERVDVGISLGIEETPDALVERALAARDEGYRKIKLKIAPGSDVEFVAAVREALGPEAPLMVDANAAYGPGDASHLARLDEFGLIMIEQPLDRTDLVRHARLQERLRTPICLDESIDCVDRAEDMLTLGSGRIINIKPGRVGGFTASLAIHDLARDAGVPVWCGGMLESGIGRAHNVALASLENFRFPGDLSPSARYWAQDIVNPEWTMAADGTAGVPWDRPGLGVDLDMDRIDGLTTRMEVVA
jgi:o-succinylbenzoate synthase